MLVAAPMRSRTTFVELLCGCLISPEGWVTRAISAIIRGRRWTTYYKLLERGSARTLRLARALFEAVNSALPMETLNLVIDDRLIPRQSEKAPGSIVWHDHARKHNRPQFLLAQCWGTLGASVLGSADRKYMLPIVSRSTPATKRSSQTWTRTSQNLWEQNDTRGNPKFTGNRNEAGTV